jgi:hypothetical protein
MESKWREVFILKKRKKKMNIATNSSSCFRIEIQERIDERKLHTVP